MARRADPATARTRGTLTGSVSLADPDAAGRGAVERLLGRAPRRGRSLSVRLEAVDHVLRRSGISPDGLAAAIRALTGPVVPVRAERDEKARAWAEAYAPLDALVTRRPELAEWADRMRGEGLVRRLAPEPRLAAALLADTASALDGLPVEPAMSLPAFAARALGNAHALDDGTALATLVLSALRRLSGFYHRAAVRSGDGRPGPRRGWSETSCRRRSSP